MNEQTKSSLIETGLVTAEQIEEAVSNSDGSDFIVNLISAAGIEEKKLYNRLSQIYRLPHASLKDRKMAPGANLVVAERCIRDWRIFPVDYDPKDGLMTLVVLDSDHAEKTERIFSFLMESFDRAYCFTNETELDEAIARELPQNAEELTKKARSGSSSNKTTQVPGSGTQRGKTKIAIPLPEKAAKKDEGTSEVKKPISSAADKKAVFQQEEEKVSDELVKSLSSAVSLLVNAHLGSYPDKLAAVQERVRYCQLAATRLGLTAVQATKVILAAWLSALADKKDVIRQFVCPYDLEEIIFAEESGRGLGIESLILTLVRAYQRMEKDSPDDAKDVNLARRALFMKWAPAAKHQDVLETFLQVLMDEQFVDKLGRHAGRILVFAGQGSDSAELHRTMERSGFAVKAVSSIESIEADVQGNDAGLLIVQAENDGRGAIQACRQITQSSDLSDIPLMVLIGEGADVKGTEFLRAGADDFLNEPIDFELLLLKTEKLIKAPSKKDGESGVSGSLADMSFSDLVQVLSAGGKSMDVRVSSGEEDGRIVLRDGNVVHAEAGSVSGEQAFYALMLWKVGQFSMSECQSFPEPTITASTMSLLMEGARLDDENAQKSG